MTIQRLLLSSELRTKTNCLAFSPLDGWRSKSQVWTQTGLPIGLGALASAALPLGKCGSTWHSAGSVFAQQFAMEPCMSKFIYFQTLSKIIIASIYWALIVDQALCIYLNISFNPCKNLVRKAPVIFCRWGTLVSDGVRAMEPGLKQPTLC